MEYFESNINVIRSQIKANKKYKEISNLFKQRFPEVRRGFSERNLRLFCSKHGISKLNEAEIDAVIQQCVSEVRLPAFHLSFDFVLLYITLFVKYQVGPTYGRKMMTGYVRSKGLPLSGKQVAKSLRRVNPADHARRREDTVRRRNPVPYNALYYGNKLHCDQNEKLGMYGCTFYALSDGCSSRIIKLFSMPKKNAVIIYAHFRFVK